MVWTYTLGALDLNDFTNWIVVQLPELDDMPVQEPVLVEMAGDYPAFIRQQPQSGTFTLNLVAIELSGSGRPISCRPETWQTRMDALRAELTPGFKTLTVQARGMAAPKSVQVIYSGMGTNYKLRLVSLDLVAPKPVFE